ncbi:gliding motility-associated C-terminal domain-containing protein [Candidatus Omnitrophota bacterium]
MRECFKYCIVNVCVIGLMLVAFAGTATGEVAEVDTLKWDAWPSTIYYLALLGGPDAPYGDITINITAVDEYTLYINGQEIGDDDDWSTVEQYTANIGGADKFTIAVEVKNTGKGNGNGLMVDIQANTDWLGTSTLYRRSFKKGDDPRKLYDVAWYSYSGDVTEVLGDDWYDPDEDYFLEITKHGFKQAMLGKINGDIQYTPDNNIEVITGYPGDIDVGNAKNTDLESIGGIRLRRVEGENLALGKPAQEEKLTDGDLVNGFGFNQDPVGIRKYLDLEDVRRVNKMVMYSGGNNPDDWERYSVRGYSVQISQDQFRYEEVGVLHEIGISNAGNGGYDWYAIDFPEEWARYLRFEITEPRVFPPNIGEMMVYGVGYVYEGMYESEWYDAGDVASHKNFDKVIWDGNIKAGTKISVQTKTKYEASDGTIVESDWSVEHTDKEFDFDSPEPALGFKYRVRLYTQDIDLTPQFNSLKVTYSDTSQPVSYAGGYILPEQVPMGELSDFVFTVDYNLQAGQNIKKIEIMVPGESTVDSIYSSDADALLDWDTTLTTSSTDILTVVLKDPLTNAVADKAGETDELKIYFKTKLLINIHDFHALLYNDENNDDAGGVMVWPKADKPLTVSTSTIIETILTNVKAVPKVFTPNGDNTNDFTVIEFTLAKVETVVKINFYNTKGRLVYSKKQDLTAKDWFIENKAGMAGIAATLPGYWDGKNKDGDLVPPGVYIYQVIADTDSGEKIEGGTVVVAY